MSSSSPSRSRSRFKPLFLAATLGLASAGGLAFAGGGERGPGGHGDPAARIARELSLDAGQKASVEAIFERHRPAREALWTRHKAHRQALEALTPGTPDYSSRAQALADEAGTLARDRVLQRTQLQAELATVLTAEQLARLDERKARAHHGRRHHRGEHSRDASDAHPES
jgi:Spy/CpxP family protein refolding chaperone